MSYRFFREFEMPKAPEFPDNIFNIIDFGAIDDGKTLCRDAVNRAIKNCSDMGGGTVLVPKGNWLFGAVNMQNNVNLHFEDGANILFSGDKKDYLPVVLTTYEAVRVYNYSPLIYGYRLENIAITGKGRLDGNGSAWWPWKKVKLGEESAYEACIMDTPVEERVYGNEEYALRSCFLEFYDCKNIYIEGISIENSSYWTVHPVWSENITIRNITIKSPYDSPNTDGINIDGCNRVLVEDCGVLGGGDDIIAIKSGRGSDGWNMDRPCENVIVRNCKGSNIRGGGIVVGSEMSGGVNNVLAENCEFENIFSCIKVKSKKGRGGFVTNMEYKNITAKNAKEAFTLTMKYPYIDGAEDKDDPKMPVLENYHVENLKCDGLQSALTIEGVEGCSFKNIYLENVELLNSGKPAVVENAENVNMENVIIK